MAVLNVFWKNENAGEWEVGNDRMILGRNPKAEIYLKESGISRNHCQFFKKDERKFTKDYNI